MSGKLNRLTRARLWEISAADWFLFFQAWTWLLIFDLALRTRPFRRVLSLAGSQSVNKPPNAQAATEQCLLAVERARHYHLYPMTCLRRSLALIKLLRQRGLRAELKIGVEKADGSLAAHAWVEVDGVVIGERGPIDTRYAKIFGKDHQD